MIPFTQYLTEMFDKPAPIKWDSFGSRCPEAEFEVDGNKFVFRVMIGASPKGKRLFEVEFYSVDSKDGSLNWNNTTGASAVTVMATVIEAARQVFSSISKLEPGETIGFDATSMSRLKLYTKLAQIIMREYPTATITKPLHNRIEIKIM